MYILISVYLSTAVINVCYKLDKLVVHRIIGIAMYKINNGLLPSVLNEQYKKNNVIHAHNTRAKDMFRVSLGTQTFSTVSARIWNACSYCKI